MNGIVKFIKTNKGKEQKEKDDLIARQTVTLASLEKNQKQALDTLRNILEGHSELAFDPSEATDELSQSVMEVVAFLNRQNVKELKTSVKLSMQASEAFSCVSFVTADSREISEVMTTVSSAVEELNVSIKQIAETTEQVSNDADKAKEISQSGLTATEKAVTSMRGIQSSVSSTLERVDKLTVASEQIGSILEVIEDIANKTNLLALNATIEAARAGEAGKGFAVVAGEVKGLSSQTAQATEQIREQIMAIRADVKDIGQAIHETNDTVGEGSQIIEAVGKDIQEMVNRIEEVAKSIADTSASVTEQTAATQEVTRSVSVVENKSKQNEVNAEKTLKAVTDMEDILAQSFADLEAKNIPGSIVEFAKSDHYAWKRKLAEMMVGTSNLSSAELSDHHSCRLGKWCDHVEDPAIRNHPAFSKLEGPHARIHTHGKRMAELFEQGDRVAAMEEYMHLNKASHDVVSLLDELSKATLSDK